MMISPPDVGIREIVCHMVMEKEEKKRKENPQLQQQIQRISQGKVSSRSAEPSSGEKKKKQSVPG